MPIRVGFLARLVLVACALLGGMAGTAGQSAVGAPMLMWSHGGCLAGPVCQTGWYASPAVADLDGDGAAEVVWGGADVVALDGAAGATNWRGPGLGRIFAGIAVADLTGDGTLEVVVGRDSDHLRAYDRFGNVLWTRNPFGGGEIRSVVVADLERDGPREILAGRADSVSAGQVSVLEADGATRGGWPARRGAEAGSNGGVWNANVVATDVNGDGLAEVIVPNGSHYINAFNRNGNQLTVHGMFAPSGFWSEAGVHVDHDVDLRGWANCGLEHRPDFSTSAAVAADLDGNGVRELVVVGSVRDCGTSPATDLYQMPFIFNLDRTRWSGAGFDWTAIPAPPPGSAPRSLDVETIEGAMPNAVAADLDGDGRREILFASYDGRVHAYWLDKTQHGAWPYTVPASGAPGDEFRFAGEPAVADVNNDGRGEVFFTSWPAKATGAAGHLHVLSDQGAELHRIALPAAPSWNGALGAPTIANIDGDADLEVVVGTVATGVVAYKLPGSGAARVLWGTGRGDAGRTGSAAAPAGPPPDTVPPTVTIDQAAGQTDPTGTSPILFTAVFSEAVLGLTSSDIVIGGTAGGVKTATVSGGPSLYSIEIGGMTTDGTVTASIPAGAAVDAAANGNTASTSADNTVSFTAAAPPQQTRIEEGSMTFTGPWSTFTDGDTGVTSTNGTIRASDVAGATATFTFTGTSVTWVGFRCEVCGPANVYLAAGTSPGMTPVATVDTFAAARPAATGAIWSSPALEPGTYTVRIEVASSAWVVVDAFDVGTGGPPAGSGWTRAEETALPVAYVSGSGTDAAGNAVPPTWFHGSTSRGWSGGLASFNRSSGARATYTFRGTTVRWIGFRAWWAGMAAVYVDGVFVRELDLYVGAGRDPNAAPCTAAARQAPPPDRCVDEAAQAVVFEAAVPNDGQPHTLTIEVLGRRNALADTHLPPEEQCAPTTCNAVVVDAFDVSQAAPVPATGRRVEESAASYDAGAWATEATRPWSGGTARVAATAGSRARFSFTGTEVRWVGLRGPGMGIARVYLDGVFHATVNAYAASDIHAVPFIAADLADALHTLEIEVTGTSASPDPGTAGTAIAVDAFDVRSRHEDGDRAITYTGTWTPDGSRNSSGTSPPRRQGIAMRTTAAGSAAEFRFSGTSVTWIGVRGPQQGVARVTVDGGALFSSDIDLAAAADQVQAPVVAIGGLPDGAHTLRIEKIDATGRAVAIDAFDIDRSMPAPPVTRRQESAVTFDAPAGTLGWVQGTMPFWSGEAARVTPTMDASATFTFTGTDVRWIGQRRLDGGIARVFIDGELRAVVDLFSFYEEFQTAVFAETLPTGGPHTLRIEAAGTNRAGFTCDPVRDERSCPTVVVIDAIETY